MRQVSIPKNIVESLNSLFDSHPAAITELMAVRAPEGQAVGASRPTIGMLEVVNAVLDSVAPGKRVATIYGPGGLDGFVLGRDRKVAVTPAES